MTIPQLDSVAVGSAMTRLGVSFFPVYLAANDLPPIATGDAAGLVVDELDQASVHALRVRNPGDRPVLVVEGEHFLGGKQNRALNATVLVPAESELEIPPAWSRAARGYHDGSRHHRTRHAAAGVSESMRTPEKATSRRCGPRSTAGPCPGGVTHGVGGRMRRQAHRREPPRAAASRGSPPAGPARPVRIVVTHGSG